LTRSRLRLSLRAKLILGFAIVILLGVVLSAVVGARYIGTTIVGQAQEKVRLDLNSAREILFQEQERVRLVVRLTAGRYFLRDAVIRADLPTLARELPLIQANERLDLLLLTDPTGRVVVPDADRASVDERPFARLLGRVLETGVDTAVVTLAPPTTLRHGGESLVARARTEVFTTPRALPRPERISEEGMMLVAAVPVRDYEGTIIGVLCGGILLNGNERLVDTIRDVVYYGQTHAGRNIGSATIFLDDIRIATNVTTTEGERAVGTEVSAEVYDQVVGQGIPWVGRAFVVNDWYFTAYEPIRDETGGIVGMLYVGMLEAPTRRLHDRVVLTYLLIALVSIVLLWVIAQYSTGRIVRPVRELVAATERISRGEFDQRVSVSTQDELGALGDSFNRMSEELAEAQGRYERLTRTLEEQVRNKSEELEAARDHLIQSEKMSSLGRLAAGIAHEINNPLTSILINSQLIAERLETPSPHEENLGLIIEETSRCSSIVKGLLEFSRQNPPELAPVDLNRLIQSSLMLIESQAMAQSVTLTTVLDEQLPRVRLDANKIKQVVTNLALNALDAMPGGGTLTITTHHLPAEGVVEMAVEDNGCGIPSEVLHRIFDPFYTTKGTTGTGLGLSVTYGIVEQHGGTITVESSVDVGTTFMIRLPLAGRAADVV
jgi:two-component system NtrC family sensor kinase